MANPEQIDSPSPSGSSAADSAPLTATAVRDLVRAEIAAALPAPSWNGGTNPTTKPLHGEPSSITVVGPGTRLSKWLG